MTNKKNTLNDYDQQVNRLLKVSKEIGEDLSKEEAEQIVYRQGVIENKAQYYRKPIVDAIASNKKLLIMLDKQMHETISRLDKNNNYVKGYSDYLSESIKKTKELLESLKNLVFSLDDMVVELED